MAESIWSIPLISGGPIELGLECGKHIFVVGANGAGKSALLQRCASHLYQRNQNHSEGKTKWIQAHRRIVIESGNVTLTSASRRSSGERRRNQFPDSSARWNDEFQVDDIEILMFDLVAMNDDLNRQVADFCKEGDPNKAKEISPRQIYELFGESSLEQINKLLKSGGFMTQLEYTSAQGFRARHENGAIFGIEQMSDGERNAMIMASQVITAERGCVLLIDEPERHLHRAIIVSFLKALFEHREDCVFIISTHEVALPAANPDAEVLMLRSCQWGTEDCESWDAVHLDSTSRLPEELKLAILGSREKILFVEGESTSMDCPIYTALFPDISVRPMGDCKEVIRAVRVLRKTQDRHHIEVFGLIDLDNRTDENVAELEDDGIFALDVYSVEGLYYCSEVIAAVARQQAESLDGRDADQLIKVGEDKAFEVLDNNEDKLDERMAKYRRDRRIFLKLADEESIVDKMGERDSISIDAEYQEALVGYKEAVTSRDLNKLVARYPLRDSRVFEVIGNALECRNRHVYQSMVIARIKKDDELKASLKKRLGGMSEKLDSVTTAQTN